MKRNIIKEVESKRVRHNFASIAGANYAIEDLKNLEKIVNSISLSNTYDLFPFNYLPVSICSSFETFFRFEINTLIDTPGFDIQRINLLKEVKDFKLGLVITDEMVKRKISTGELVSHLVKINSILSIDRIISCLTQRNFFKTLRNFETSYKSEWYLTLIDYWRKNYNQIIKDLKTVYELRNIACHEFGYIIDISKEVLYRYLRNSIVFLDMTSLYLNRPYSAVQPKELKLSELTRSKRSFQKSEKQLEDLVTQICEATTKVWFDTVSLTSDLQSEIFLWKQHRKKLAKTLTEEYCTPPSDYWMYWNNMEMLTIEKISTLSERYQYLFTEIECSSNIQSFG